MSRQTRSTAKKLTRLNASIPPLHPPRVPTLETQLFNTPSSWESWLSVNHGTNTTGLWLKIAKKDSGVTSVTYDQALDVALCYGWIDGQRKALDAQHFIQRFTPRRKGSMWSQRNVNKVASLVEAERMKPAGQAEIDAAKSDGRWDRAYSSSSNAVVPEDFQAALDGSEAAGELFKGLNRTKRYAFIQRLETAKRPDTRTKRIEQFIALLASGKSLG
ncbi:bacteriocin-protection, YdeI or OmpD-associated-domain-containing protein [Fusarium avenaceum]|nr:bacteriocin-protection, YdeI or OmpD-associated-domain-containing protein [Fusarium avenaceum]